MDDARHEPRPGRRQTGKGLQRQAVAQVAGLDQTGIGESHRLAQEPRVEQRLRDLAHRPVEVGGPARTSGERHPGRDAEAMGRMRAAADQLERDQIAGQPDQEPGTRRIGRAGRLRGDGQPARDG